MNDNIYILLATYNGEKYLDAQIKSIQSQTIDDWTLFIRDDGSTDRTRSLISEYAANDKRIKIISDDKNNLGVVRNFSVLVQQALKNNAGYIFFADQDDVWFPNKITDSIKKIKELEDTSPSGAPVLIHTDLCVTDNELNTVSPSFIQHMAIRRPESQQLNVLLLQNFVTGCTTCVNRHLLELSSPLPERIMMHDWWFALVAATFGRIGFIPEATIYYRQHSDNVAGANRLSKQMLSMSFEDKINSLRFATRGLLKTFEQAGKLLRLIKSSNSPTDKDVEDIVRGYSDLLRHSPLRRLYFVYKNSIYGKGLQRKIFLAIQLLLIRNKH
jgi:glycosyltransferase involved in cell wall biosynthesis